MIPQYSERFRLPSVDGMMVYVIEAEVFLGHRGPPPIIPIPHRPPQLAPEEVPRVVAKARAVAVFGPKRGRWK